MSFGKFLFGNVDKDGQLDSNIDGDVGQLLSTLGNDFLDEIMGDAFKETTSKSATPAEINSGKIKPQAKALDYSEIDEFIEDDFTSSIPILPTQVNLNPVLPNGRELEIEDDYDDEEPTVEVKPVAKPPVSVPLALNTTQKELVKEIKPELLVASPAIIPEPELSFEDIKKAYPAFEPNAILKFSEVFENPNFKRYRVDAPKPKANSSKKELEIVLARDTRELMDDSEDKPNSGFLQQLLKKIGEALPAAKTATEEFVDSEENAHSSFPYIPIEMENWEDKIIWTEEDKCESEAKTTNVVDFHNHELENGDWESNIFLDKEDASKLRFPVVMDLNDTNMLFEIVKNKPVQQKVRNHARGIKLLKRVKKLGVKGIDILGDKANRDQLDKFNLSNDLYYETLQSGRSQKVRQTFGQIVIQHSTVALRTQPPFFKTRLTKTDLRRWHRVPVRFPIGVNIKLNRVKAVKKKKLKLKPNQELMPTPKEVTLKDNSPFLLIEYSEEYPPVIQNVGMGSMLINYYRKKTPEDDYIHDPPLGEPITLEVTDVSPFLNFGNVEPGETMLALYNNLLRVPVFRHKPACTDFILVKQSLNGKTKYYLRKIADMYTAGQTYPTQEVPGPHSRKITATIKNRLQAATFRLINSNPHKHLKIQSLSRMFPEYNEGQIRTKLKEFAEFQRVGPSAGYWKLKPSVILPDEEELRKMVTPEMLCLYESMLVGKQHLQDAGYGKSAEAEADETTSSKLTIEEQLAPWITTRNFINATQGKAMLKLNGEGDPTGRGEGFSYIWVSMKDIFLKAGEKAEEKLAEIEARPKSAHRYNVADQQQNYREEITRIWNKQKESLGSSKDFPLTDEESDEDLDLNHPLPKLPGTNNSTEVVSNDNQASSSKRPDSPSADVKDDASNISIDSKANENMNKVLVIKRKLVVDGVETWQTESIRNPAVIKAYASRRAQITEPIDSEKPSTEILHKRIKLQIEKVRRSRDRRLEKAREQAASQGGTIPSHLAPKGKKELVRRCGNCGELGHMKTNRACKKYPKGDEPTSALTGVSSPN